MITDKEHILASARKGVPNQLEIVRKEGWWAPIERTFGIEIELYSTDFGLERRDVQRLMLSSIDEDVLSPDMAAWRVKGDNSIHPPYPPYGNTMEIVSPILKGAQGMYQVYEMCEFLGALPLAQNKTCSVHVHHAAEGVTTRGLGALVRLYDRGRAALYRMFSPTRIRNKYCRMFPHNELTAIYCNTALNDDLRSLPYTIRSERYRAINIYAIPSHGTIEFRQHHATLNAQEIMDWVYLSGALLDLAEQNPDKAPEMAQTGSITRLTEHLWVPQDTRTRLIARATRNSDYYTKIGV